MNISELKIRNTIYEYGLSDEQVALLEKKSTVRHIGTTYYFTQNNVAFGVESRFHKSNVNDIVTKKIKEGATFTTPISHMAGCVFQFSIDDDETMECLSYLIEEVIQRGYSRDYNFTGNNNKTLYNLKHTKESIIRYLLATISSDSSFHNYARGDIKALFWLFDEPMPEGFGESHISDGNIEDGFLKIVKVFESDNKRLSIMTDDTEKNPFLVNVYTLENEEYNYVDEGRYMTKSRKFIWDDLNIKGLEYDYVEKTGRYRDFVLVNKEMYDNAKIRYRLKVKKEKEDEELQEKMESEFRKKIYNLKEKPIVVNGIRFEHNSITYEGQVIKGTLGTSRLEDSWRYSTNRDVKTVSDFIIYELKNHENDTSTLDFNTLFQCFCGYLRERDFKGTLGNVDVEIEADVSINKNGSDIARWEVNNIRINKDDVVDVVKRALCFEKADDFEEMLEKVSKCNLKFHDIISNGLNIRFFDYDSSYDGNLMRFQIKRLGSRNYLVLGDDEYKITNTNLLVGCSTLNKNADNRFGHIIEIFKKVFPDMSDEVLGGAFKEGLKEHEKAVKKSQEFLDEAIKILKVSEAEKDGESGYLVTGTSGKQYLLTRALKVYEYETMKYVCIVDKGLDKGFKNDKIVNRLYALANDSLISSQVHTLRV